MSLLLMAKSKAAPAAQHDATPSQHPRKLEVLRKALGISHEAMAERLGLSVDFTRRLLWTTRHRREMNKVTADKVESLWGVSADCMMSDDGAPLIRPNGEAWKPAAQRVPSVAFQTESARINAILGGAALRAIYVSAAKREKVGACVARVAAMLSELEREFGLDGETYRAMQAGLDGQRLESERRLDEIQRAEFKESAGYARLNAGGVVVIGGQRLRVKPGMVREALDSIDGKASVPEGYWQRKGKHSAAPAPSPKASKAKRAKSA